MILRKRPIYILSLFSLLQFTGFVVTAAAQDAPFDCHVSVGSLKYDLSVFAGEHTLSRKRETPPSAMEDDLRFNLCGELKTLEGVAEGDQCPAGTRACLTKVNKKADTTDRIVAVIPIAQTSTLQPEYSAISSPKGLSLILHGASYPHPTTAIATPQSLNATLLCATDASEPKFLQYDGTQLCIEWSGPGACAFKGDQPPGDHKEEEEEKKSKESVGSGIGFFFVVLLLAFAAYFGLGAYYNYTTYGASGVDLIPHRDFWREVPYMFRDVISHLCSSASSRARHTNRGGYIAV